MNKTNMKSIVILKNLPSNLFDEAIVIIKDKKKIGDKEGNKLIKNQKKLLNINKENKKSICEYITKEELGKIKKTEKEDRKYVIKEAELVIGNYLSDIEKREKEKNTKKLQAKCKRIRTINLILTILTVISFIVAIKK